MSFLEVFDNCLEYVKRDYCNFNFYCERDFVWTIQKLIAEYIHDNKLPFKVLNDFPIESGVRRSKSVDLAIIRNDLDDRDVLYGKAQAEFVVEFKFEPSKMRKDEICVHKLPVVQWSEVLKDIERVHRFVDSKLAKCSVAILVDEFGRYTNPQHTPGNSTWINWGNCNSQKLNVSILYTECK